MVMAITAMMISITSDINKTTLNLVIYLLLLNNEHTTKENYFHFLSWSNGITTNVCVLRTTHTYDYRPHFEVLSSNLDVVVTQSLQAYIGANRIIKSNQIFYFMCIAHACCGF